MRRHIRASMAAAAVAFGIQIAAFAQGSIAVDVAGAPANAMIDLALNGGKIADVSTGTDGSGTATIDPGSGEQQIQVWVERCQDGKVVRIQMVVVGNTLPEDEDCDRKLVGVFWRHRARRIVVDVASATA